MEKRKIIALLGLLLFVAAGNAHAASKNIASGAAYNGVKGTGASQTLGHLSTNVSAIVSYDPTTYAVTTHHLNGNKEYGSSAGDTRIFVADRASGTALPESPSASDSTAFNATTWSSL